MSNKSIKLQDTIRAPNETCPVSMAIQVPQVDLLCEWRSRNQSRPISTDLE